MDIVKFIDKHPVVPKFRGCFMRDSLPKKPWKCESGIVNLNETWQEGSHWVAYKIENKLVNYFDPMGNLPPPLELRKYFGCTTIRYNHDRYQKYGSVNCGHLCIAFISDINIKEAHDHHQ